MEYSLVKVSHETNVSDGNNRNGNNLRSKKEEKALYSWLVRNINSLDIPEYIVIITMRDL